jgi:hypothetical protein
MLKLGNTKLLNTKKRLTYKLYQNLKHKSYEDNLCTKCYIVKVVNISYVYNLLTFQKNESYGIFLPKMKSCTRI